MTGVLQTLCHGLSHHAHEDLGRALQAEQHHLPLKLPQLLQEAGLPQILLQ